MSTPEITDLPRPGAVEGASNAAVEILSVWIADGRDLAAVFPPELYGEDVWKWGRLLAALARYIAHAHGQASGADETDALDSIRLNFDESLRTFLADNRRVDGALMDRGDT